MIPDPLYMVARYRKTKTERQRIEMLVAYAQINLVEIEDVAEMLFWVGGIEIPYSTISAARKALRNRNER